MTVKAEGPTGHGSRFIKDPATQKLMRAVQHFLDYRDLQEAKMLHGRATEHGAECAHAQASRMPLALGDVISVNLTVLKAGVTVDNGATYSYNVVPMVSALQHFFFFCTKQCSGEASAHRENLCIGADATIRFFLLRLLFALAPSL
jgi:hypothetical protein